MTEQEVEGLNPETVDIDSLTPEELEDVSGGGCIGFSCGTFSDNLE